MNHFHSAPETAAVDPEMMSIYEVWSSLPILISTSPSDLYLITAPDYWLCSCRLYYKEDGILWVEKSNWCIIE